MACQFSEGLQPVDPTDTHIYPSIDHLTAVAQSGRAPGKLWCPCSVAIDQAANRIYVAEGGYNFARVSIFSESGNYLNSYTHKHMKSLWGIAIHGNSVYVTDCEVHAVFHLKIKADLCLVAKRGSRGSGIRQFNYPRQLSTSTNGDVYIADGDNHRIKILDSSLHPIRIVTHPSMHYPCDLKLTTEEMYVISTVDSFCVHVFTHTGHKIRSLIPRGGRLGKQPFFFCIDAELNIIISDCSLNQIRIFSNVGDLLYTLGEYGNYAGMFVYPHGVALTSNLSLICVSRNYFYQLQIFSPL